MTLRLRRLGFSILAWGAVFASANALAGNQYDQCPTEQPAGATAPVPNANCVADIDSAKSKCAANKGKRADCDTQCQFINDNHVGIWAQAKQILACYNEAEASSAAGAGQALTGDALKDVNTRIANIRNAQSQIQKMLDNAKNGKPPDIVKINCLNDKLIQVRGHTTVAQNSIAALNAAGDNATARHEAARIQILGEKVDTLFTEAQACTGNEASYVGNTSIDVWIDPNIPNDDPTEPPLPLPDVTRPPEASPFI